MHHTEEKMYGKRERKVNVKNEKTRIQCTLFCVFQFKKYKVNFIFARMNLHLYCRNFSVFLPFLKVQTPKIVSSKKCKIFPEI
jgi:hypothetical protein